MAEEKSFEHRLVDALAEMAKKPDANIFEVAGIMEKHCGDDLGPPTFKGSKTVKVMKPEVVK